MDACAFISCYRNALLALLYQYYRLETVERVIQEVQSVPSSYHQHTRINPVTARQIEAIRSQSIEKFFKPPIKKGEVFLWVHAYSLADTKWRICGPDRDNILIGCALGLEHKIVSVEELLREAGLNQEADELVNNPLMYHLTKKWQAEKLPNLLAVNKF